MANHSLVGLAGGLDHLLVGHDRLVGRRAGIGLVAGVDELAARGRVALAGLGHAGADPALEGLLRGHRCSSAAAALGTHAPECPTGKGERPASRWLEATSTSASRWREHRMEVRRRTAPPAASRTTSRRQRRRAAPVRVVDGTVADGVAGVHERVARDAAVVVECRDRGASCSSSCAIVRGPTIGAVIPGWSFTHSSASCDGVTPARRPPVGATSSPPRSRGLGSLDPGGTRRLPASCRRSRSGRRGCPRRAVTTAGLRARTARRAARARSRCAGRAGCTAAARSRTRATPARGERPASTISPRGIASTRRRTAPSRRRRARPSPRAVSSCATSKRRPVELVQVDRVDAEPTQRSVAALGDVRRIEELAPLPFRMGMPTLVATSTSHGSRESAATRRAPPRSDRGRTRRRCRRASRPHPEPGRGCPRPPRPV